MKKVIFILMLLPSFAFAEEFTFAWGTPQGLLKYKTEAKSWNTAYEHAADFCFDFLSKKEINMNEEKGLQIIDVCANPVRDNK